MARSVEVRALAFHELAAVCRAFPGRPAWRHRLRLEQQRRGELRYLVAWTRSSPVGFAVVRWPGWPERPEVHEAAQREQCAHVEDLFVLPEYRRRGVAREVMAAAEEAARAQGFGKVGLGVGLDEDYAPARALYGELGYRDWGHGPWIGAVSLTGPDGSRMVFWGWQTYLVREVEPA